MKDLFSEHARQYATFRPGYPAALYEALLGHVDNRLHAWDAGCGNGQVAKDLARYFEQVTASDLSEKQIQQAEGITRVTYHVGRAEQTPFAANSFDLITVAQALHWFDIPKFFQEVQRVAKPGALVAVWGYNLLRVDDEVDEILNHFYTHVVGPYWDPARKLVDDQYQHIEFPFAELKLPPFFITYEWTLAQLHGYITTWSAVQQYMRVQSNNPVDALAAALSPHWRGARQVVFPIFLRTGKVEKSV